MLSTSPPLSTVDVRRANLHALTQRAAILSHTLDFSLDRLRAHTLDFYSAPLSKHVAASDNAPGARALGAPTSSGLLAWQNEPRDTRGQWTRGASGARASDAGVLNRVRPPQVPPSVPLPREGWDGARGHSLWRPQEASEAAQAVGEIGGVQFRRGFPKFAPFVPQIAGLKARVAISFSGDRDTDFRAGDRALAQRLGWSKRGKPDAARVKRYRQQKRLTWHHHENCNSPRMELVPTALHSAVPHAGGHSLCA